MDKINNRNDWVFGHIKNPFEDKQYFLRSVVTQMLNKSTKMFKYNNLPETILAKDLETQLQVNGFAIWKEVDGKLYTFVGGLGGEPNPYYLPTKAVVANPALRYNASLIIEEECVVMLNDHYYQGLMPLFNRYGNLLVEAEMSLKFAIINARVPALIQADNDAAYASATAFFKKIVSGEEYGIIQTKQMLEGITSHDFYKIPYIKDLIESIQYIKGSWYNELGLSAQFNMKREAINEAEATMNEDILYPTIDNMLECRKLALEKVNAMYGTNITVEFDGIWADNQHLNDLNIEKEEAEIEEIKEEEPIEDDRDPDNESEDGDA